jgi:hypothetical protein
MLRCTSVAQLKNLSGLQVNFVITPCEPTSRVTLWYDGVVKAKHVTARHCKCPAPRYVSRSRGSKILLLTLSPSVTLTLRYVALNPNTQFMSDWAIIHKTAHLFFDPHGSLGHLQHD